MQQRGIVPDNHVADAVFQAQLVFLLRRVALQLVEEIDRLVFAHPLDAEGAARDRIERGAPGDGMLPRHRMAHPSHLLLLVFAENRGNGSRALVLVVTIAVMVQRNQIADLLLQIGRQAVIGGVLVREQRVAADLRHLDRVERGAARRHIEVRVVGVEVGPRVGEAGRLAVLLYVGEDQDVGVLGMVELVDDVRLGTAELPRELEESAGAEFLMAEDKDLRGEESVPDFAEIPGNPLGLDAESVAERLHAFSLGTSSHFFAFQLFSPSSASCTPFAPSCNPQRNLPSPATCLRNSSHCTLKALSALSSGTSSQLWKKSIGCGMSGFHTGLGVFSYDCE